MKMKTLYIKIPWLQRTSLSQEMYSFKYIQKTLKNIKSLINKLKMYLKNLLKQ